ncbi:hypothetical protein WN943_025441 [Citrus x changshan-huyou]
MLHHGANAVTSILVAILILLFYVQRFGTDKVGASFALIILVWFPFLFMIGLYDLFKYDATALRALNPWYIMKYFIQNGKNAWISLGGVVMCITSPEAMFVDLGHFSAGWAECRSLAGGLVPSLGCKMGVLVVSTKGCATTLDARAWVGGTRNISQACEHMGARVLGTGRTSARRADVGRMDAQGA